MCVCLCEKGDGHAQTHRHRHRHRHRHTDTDTDRHSIHPPPHKHLQHETIFQNEEAPLPFPRGVQKRPLPKRARLLHACDNLHLVRHGSKRSKEKQTESRKSKVACPLCRVVLVLEDNKLLWSLHHIVLVTAIPLSQSGKCVAANQNNQQQPLFFLLLFLFLHLFPCLLIEYRHGTWTAEDPGAAKSRPEESKGEVVSKTQTRKTKKTKNKKKTRTRDSSTQALFPVFFFFFFSFFHSFLSNIYFLLVCCCGGFVVALWCRWAKKRLETTPRTPRRRLTFCVKLARSNLFFLCQQTFTKQTHKTIGLCKLASGRK